MAKIKNTFGEDRIVPWLGDRLVLAGQVVDVPDDDVYAYTQQSGWAPFDDQAKALHEAAETVAEEVEAVVSGDESAEPAGNASREVWAAYVVAAGLATEDQLLDADGEPLGRDAIRDTYKHEEN